MASNNEQLDAAERNILYLKELKAVIIAKTQLLKLKQLDEEIKPKESSSINIEADKKKLISTKLEQTYIDKATLHTVLNLFINKNLINNESDSDDILEFKEKFYKCLQEIKHSSHNIHILLKRLRNLTQRRNELLEELFTFRTEHEKRFEQIINQTELNKTRAQLAESYDGRKQQIMSRVEKINVMIKFINGLVLNTKELDFSDDPEMKAVIKMCQRVYEVTDL